MNTSSYTLFNLSYYYEVIRVKHLYLQSKVSLFILITCSVHSDYKLS